jgi:hypothetical protein
MNIALPVLEQSPAVKRVAALVRQECLRPTNLFGAEFFAEHLELVTRLGSTLAGRLGADPLVVMLAGYLHDLSAVRDLATLQDHGRHSARLALQILPAAGFSEGITDAVARCVESHSTPPMPGEGTPEDICLSNADVLSHLARTVYWCFYLFRVRGLDYAQGLEWLRARVSLCQQRLVPEARELGAGDCATVTRMLEQAGAQ